MVRLIYISVLQYYWEPQKIAYITIYIRVSGQWTEQLFAPPGERLDYKWIYMQVAHMLCIVYHVIPKIKVDESADKEKTFT